MTETIFWPSVMKKEISFGPLKSKIAVRWFEKSITGIMKGAIISMKDTQKNDENEQQAPLSLQWQNSGGLCVSDEDATPRESVFLESLECEHVQKEEFKDKVPPKEEINPPKTLLEAVVVNAVVVISVIVICIFTLGSIYFHTTLYSNSFVIRPERLKITGMACLAYFIVAIISTILTKFICALFPNSKTKIQYTNDAVIAMVFLGIAFILIPDIFFGY